MVQKVSWLAMLGGLADGRWWARHYQCEYASMQGDVGDLAANSVPHASTLNRLQRPAGLGWHLLMLSYLRSKDISSVYLIAGSRQEGHSAHSTPEVVHLTACRRSTCCRRQGSSPVSGQGVV